MTRNAQRDGEYEGEGEQFLGDIVKGVGSLFGLGEGEFEGESEFETEGEQFLGGITRFIRKFRPLIDRVVKKAVPAVSQAVAGPLGGKIFQATGLPLGEGEFEYEMEGEFENEFQSEAEWETPLTEYEALGELMASVASAAQTEMEAEAMIGAATVTVLSPRDRRALRSLIPSLVRGASVLSTILRRSRLKPAVKLVPGVVTGAVKRLERRISNGKPVNKQIAARVMAAQTRRVLTNPRIMTKAFQRNFRAARAAAANRRMPRQRRVPIR